MTDKTTIIPIEKDDLWSDVFGSGWEMMPWWQGIGYEGEADWETPGVARLTIYTDMDTDDTCDTVTVDMDSLVKAVALAVKSVHPSMCNLEDIDAEFGDVILQCAVLGEVRYG